MSDDWIRPNRLFKSEQNKFNKISEEESKHKYKCKCGHTVLIPYNVDTTMCTWCKRKVHKDDKRFFRDKMRQMLNNKEVKK